MYESLTTRLESFIERHLPLIKNMGLEIASYDGQKFIVQAPLSENHNDKNTAFGGSLYNLCLVNAIGLAFLKCFERGINPDLIVSKAEIQYLKPVSNTVIQSCCLSPSDSEWEIFFKQFYETGKAKQPLQAIALSNNDEAVIFNGMFALIGESETTII